MTHAEFASLLTDYVDGTLVSAEGAACEQHAAACESCRTMLADARLAVEVCRAAEDVTPAPWLLPRILRATAGARQPSLAMRVAAWSRPPYGLRVAYSAAMALFSLSFVLYVAKVNVRAVKLSDLNPKTWIYRADRHGHILAGRAQRFYEDLRFVYEVQSLLRELGQGKGTPAGDPSKIQGERGSLRLAPSISGDGALADAPYRRLGIGGSGERQGGVT